MGTTDAEKVAAQLRRRAERAMDISHRAAQLERARERWSAGELIPRQITHALDSAGLDGPEVDTACGALEPAVDEWEAGVRYPTFEQLLLLAELTGRHLEWFFARDGSVDLDIRDTSIWGHMTERERQRWRDPVEQYTSEALESCPGTTEYRLTHLF